MAVLNEVKMRVRSNALDLIEFTVEKMQQVTGLNPASIRTELIRMKREGYLTSKPSPVARKGRGAPPHLYRLADNENKLDELAQSVESFYQLSLPVSFEPTSLHYEAACTVLDQLEAGQVIPTAREATLAQAAYHLDLATEDEGVDAKQDDRSQVVLAYLDLLRTRLAVVRGDLDEAEVHLIRAQSTFIAHQVSEGLQKADTLANALAIEKAIAGVPDTYLLIQRLLKTLKSRRGNVPVLTVCRLLKQVQIDQDVSPLALLFPRIQEISQEVSSEEPPVLAELQDELSEHYASILVYLWKLQSGSPDIFLPYASNLAQGLPTERTRRLSSQIESARAKRIALFANCWAARQEVVAQVRLEHDERRSSPETPIAQQSDLHFNEQGGEPVGFFHSRRHSVREVLISNDWLESDIDH